MATKPKNKVKRHAPPTIAGIVSRFYGDFMTSAEQRKAARKETNIAMNDSMLKLRGTYQRERERTLREQYAQGAWAGLLKGYGSEGSAESETIKNAYARAAGLTEAESRGFITPTIAQQQSNVDTGQATAQNLAGFHGDIGSVQPGVNAGVLNYLAGLPRGTFAAQAESAAKGLGRAGAEAGGEFALREAQLGQTLRELQDSYTMGVRELQSKRPGMLSEATAGYREGSRQDIATLISALGLQSQMGGQAFEQGLSNREFGLKKQQTQAEILKSMGLSPKGQVLPDYYRAPDGRVRKIPYGSKIGKGGKLVPDKNNPARSSASKGQKATQDRQIYFENVRADMIRAAKSEPLWTKPTASDSGFGGFSTKGKQPVRVSKAKARSYLMTNFGADAMSRYPGQKAAIKRMIEQVLNSLGFK